MHGNNNKFRVMLTWDGRMGNAFEEAYTRASIVLIMFYFLRWESGIPVFIILLCISFEYLKYLS